jgi:hypothetical protein
LGRLDAVDEQRVRSFPFRSVPDVWDQELDAESVGMIGQERRALALFAPCVDCLWGRLRSAVAVRSISCCSSEQRPFLGRHAAGGSIPTDIFFKLDLTPQEKSDLIEYLKSLPEAKSATGDSSR